MRNFYILFKQKCFKRFHWQKRKSTSDGWFCSQRNTCKHFSRSNTITWSLGFYYYFFISGDRCNRSSTFTQYLGKILCKWIISRDLDPILSFDYIDSINLCNTFRKHSTYFCPDIWYCKIAMCSIFDHFCIVFFEKEFSSVKKTPLSSSKRAKMTIKSRK